MRTCLGVFAMMGGLLAVTGCVPQPGYGAAGYSAPATSYGYSAPTEYVAPVPVYGYDSGPSYYRGGGGYDRRRYDNDYRRSEQRRDYRQDQRQEQRREAQRPPPQQPRREAPPQQGQSRNQRENGLLAPFAR